MHVAGPGHGKSVLREEKKRKQNVLRRLFLFTVNNSNVAGRTPPTYLRLFIALLPFLCATIAQGTSRLGRLSFQPHFASPRQQCRAVSRPRSPRSQVQCRSQASSGSGLAQRAPWAAEDRPPTRKVRIFARCFQLFTPSPPERPFRCGIERDAKCERRNPISAVAIFITSSLEAGSFSQPLFTRT